MVNLIADLSGIISRWKRLGLFGCVGRTISVINIRILELQDWSIDWFPDSMDSALLRAIFQFTTATSVSLDEETGLLTLLTKEEAGNSRVW